MVNYIKICPNCTETKLNTTVEEHKWSYEHGFSAEFDKGIIGRRWKNEMPTTNLHKCPYCQTKLIESNMTSDDIWDIDLATKGNRQVLDAIMELKNKDIIEYELKMAQFRSIAEQKRQEIENEIQATINKDKSKPKCPNCGSTAIGVINRGYSFWTGFLGSGSPRNVCKNCGYKWKAGK